MLKAVYYTNQFFAGLGGEELADIGLGMFDEPKGPAVGLTRQWKGEMEVVRTIYAGDNFINVDENFEAIGDELLKWSSQLKPMSCWQVRHLMPGATA